MKDRMSSWLGELPDLIDQWLIRMMDPDRFGLFKDCADAPMPHCLSASGAGAWLLSDTRPLESLPNYERKALADTVQYVQELQDPESGFFIDPYLDERVLNREGQGVLEAFRSAITKYTIMFLEQAGAAPRYPYSKTGGPGAPDARRYVERLETGDWSRPWGTGSQAAGMTKELFEYLNRGHEEVIPALERGMQIILSHQNPDTGLWGMGDIPIEQQMSGAFKIMAGPFWVTGFNFPHVERLADTILRLWRDGTFQAMDDALIPRNVAELCVLCLELSEYRRSELVDALHRIAGTFQEYQMPDGAFASTRDGTGAIHWCGSLVADPSDTARSNMNGTQAVRFILSIVAPYIEWTGCPWPFPRGDWRDKLRQNPYRMLRDETGRVRIVSAN